MLNCIAGTRMRGRKKVASDCTTYPSMRGAVQINILVHAVQMANVDF